jgi:hypothetical protein
LYRSSGFLVSKLRVFYPKLRVILAKLRVIYPKLRVILAKLRVIYPELRVPGIEASGSWYRSFG